MYLIIHAVGKNLSFEIYADNVITESVGRFVYVRTGKIYILVL